MTYMGFDLWDRLKAFGRVIGKPVREVGSEPGELLIASYKPGDVRFYRIEESMEFGGTRSYGPVRWMIHKDLALYLDGLVDGAKKTCVVFGRSL